MKKIFRVDWTNKEGEGFGRLFEEYQEAKGFMISLIAKNYAAFENHEKAFNIRIYPETVSY